MSFPVGEKVGYYQILEQLGKGGMATVFKAYHTILNRYVALKVLHPAFYSDPNFMERFEREARVVAGLEHPNIVPVYDFAEHSGLSFLVMKFIEGETLKARLLRSPVSKRRGCDIIHAVCKGLSYAHNHGVLHRDIKPSNVLLDTDGFIYLSDFGVARIVSAGTSTISHEVLIGTPKYLSPEQAKSVPDLDTRTDIYSLGVVFYEMITGRVPFDADTPMSIIYDQLHVNPPAPSSLVPNISERMEEVILRSLAKDREDRFTSVRAMLFAFREAVEEGDLGVMKDLEPQSPAIQPPDEQKPKVAEVARPIYDVIAGKWIQADGHKPAILASDNGVHFALTGKRLLIGRADKRRALYPDIDLTEVEPMHNTSGKRRRTVHREQAWLFWSEEGWSIEVIPGKEDRAWLNGEPMMKGCRYLLGPGDEIKFGAVELIYKL